ncbi:MAG TPA: hypothetical protein VFV80_09530 [Geminicoccaceae bacterium]|nr:hypothetical protein [Geminicoccaceae bacterium]
MRDDRAKTPERAENWPQARERIDRGETGDKVAVLDPAAAPLGTDAEAGGWPTASEDIARSTAAEAASAAQRQTRATPPLLFALVVAAALLACIAALALALAV